jgi:hypothetical protein
MWQGHALEVPGHARPGPRPCGVTSGPGRATRLRILSRFQFESENCDRPGPLVGDTRVGRARTAKTPEPVSRTWPEQGTMKNTQ